MNTLLVLAIGAVLCALWFPVQGRIFEWKNNNETLSRKIVWYSTLMLYSASITAIYFTLIAMGCAWLLSQIF